jgi:uncharacterized iron-regulated membrane protein
VIKWPHYTSVWRWHFYAGLLCIPFVCWLAVTGSIYLFRSDYEAWRDRPVEHLEFVGSRQSPAAEAAAALSSLPGSTFSRYEPAATAKGAAQIVVQKHGELFRIVVHPRTLAVLRTEKESDRLMEMVFALHGSLGAGDPGSYVMETAASWTIVMILSGLFLWFPRNVKSVWGVLFPRLGANGRVWWRDLHAVSGVWISLIVLIMLLSGLPWASGWGNYFVWMRDLTTATATAPDWPISKQAASGISDSDSTMPGMTAAEMAAMPSAGPSNDAGRSEPLGWTLRDLDVVVPAVERQDLVRPVWILPPSKPGESWIGTSQAQDRTERHQVKVDATNGEILEASSFEDLPRLDKIVNVGVSLHEGHLFGRVNQAILLTTAIVLVGMSVSAVAMWWRRRPDGRLGAPRPAAERHRVIGLWLTIGLLAILFPMFGASLLAVLLVERLVLVRIPRVSQWLGLQTR